MPDATHTVAISVAAARTAGRYDQYAAVAVRQTPLHLFVPRDAYRAIQQPSVHGGVANCRSAMEIIPGVAGPDRMRCFAGHYDGGPTLAECAACPHREPVTAAAHATVTISRGRKEILIDRRLEAPPAKAVKAVAKLAKPVGISTVSPPPKKFALTAEQQARRDQRAAACETCKFSEGVSVASVRCGHCKCSGLSLIAAETKCPTGKWGAATTAKPAAAKSAAAQKTQIPIVLRTRLSPGDIVTLTAAVRDLAKAHPGKYAIYVDTSCKELWQNNPYISKDKPPKDARVLDMKYPLVHQSNQIPLHFIHGYRMNLEEHLGIKIPATAFKGDIHLSPQEKSWSNQVKQQFDHDGPFWILMAGGKWDFTTKWWNPRYWQDVVDHFQGRVKFVQCGEKSHFHPPLAGVLNLVGQTTLRQFVRLIHHAAGVVCPVTAAMHLSAAVETKNGRLRPCVVLGGGREPVHWEAYPGHQYLHTIGMLPCCEKGACWKSRAQKIGDGDEKDKKLCDRPVKVPGEFTIKGKPVEGISIAQCMDMITPDQVIRAIEGYLGHE